MKYKILLVTPNPIQARFLRDLTDGEFQWTIVGRLDAALLRVEIEIFDAALLALSLPDSHGLVTFQRFHAAAPHLAVIALAQPDHEDVSMACIRAGVQDYLVINETQKSLPLSNIIRNAIDRRAFLSDIQSNAMIDDSTGFYNLDGFVEACKSHLRFARVTRRDLFLVLLRIESHGIAVAGPLAVEAIRRLVPVICVARSADNEIGILMPELNGDALSGAINRAIQSSWPELHWSMAYTPVQTGLFASIEPFIGYARQLVSDSCVGVTPV